MYCCDTIFPIQAAIRISIFRPALTSDFNSWFTYRSHSHRAALH
jgi:hypothetical protein